MPIYPPALDEAPLNLHTHGLHVSPSGNADNVLLSIPAGMGNTYTYDVPTNMPNGLYWYHSHRHTMTAQQTYCGLAGLLEIGRPDGNLPLVTQNDIPDPRHGDCSTTSSSTATARRSPAQQLRLAAVGQHAEAAGGQPTRRRHVSAEPGAGELRRDHEGRRVLHATGGPGRCRRTTTAARTSSSRESETFTARRRSRRANPTLPENQRDVQFTINGQFQPELKIKPGQTEIWAVANISDIAYMTLQIDRDGDRQPPEVRRSSGRTATRTPRCSGPSTVTERRSSIPPGSRYAIAVTMPKKAIWSWSSRRTPRPSRSTNPGVLYTNNGTKNTPAVLGTLTVDPKYISYADGFFVFPTQTLMPRHAGHQRRGADHGVRAGPEPRRVHVIRGHVGDGPRRQTGDRRSPAPIGGDKASNNDPKAVIYMFDDQRLPERPADPAAAELRRGMDDHQLSTTTRIRCTSTSTTFR